MKVLKALHTGYCLIVFVLLFFIFFIPLLIPIYFPKKHHLVGEINRVWGHCIFILCFIPVGIEVRSKLDRKRQYIFCPNHFSYADIPLMGGMTPVNTIFVGKSALERIPLFGFMYRRLHITVDRARLMSKFNTLKRSLQAIDEGKSLVIYPEGGITTHHPPQMASFKDGPFRIAIEKQIPIVPVTIPYNWILLPAHELLINWRPIKLIFHEPVETKGLTIEDLDDLKVKVHDIIQTELDKYNRK